MTTLSWEGNLGGKKPCRAEYLVTMVTDAEEIL